MRTLFIFALFITACSSEVGPPALGEIDHGTWRIVCENGVCTEQHTYGSIDAGVD